MDKLTYASNGWERLRDIDAFDDKRVLAVAADFAQPISEGVKQEIGKVDYIIHMGAESHVDNSITDPLPFVRSNVEGTVHMLNLARELKPKVFFYFSTDEVFGPAPDGVDYKEDDRHNPTNPYAASKSAGEMFCRAYRNTYQMPIVITRSMNIFGERQHQEKFIPMCIKKVRDGETVTIHSHPDKKRAGTRFYIHGRNVADGYLFLISIAEQWGYLGLCTGESPDYHITGELEVDNLQLAQHIANIQDKELKYEMVDFHSARPGHDLRYALSGEKLAGLGWKPPKTFLTSLEKTVNWTLENKKWL